MPTSFAAYDCQELVAFILILIFSVIPTGLILARTYMCPSYRSIMPRRFKPPLDRRMPTAKRSAYVCARERRADADHAKGLTMDEARRVASNIAKLPTLLIKR